MGPAEIGKEGRSLGRALVALMGELNKKVPEAEIQGVPINPFELQGIQDPVE